MNESKNKPAANRDIDRWLKAAEALEKDLEELQAAKKKAEDKMKKIGKVEKKKKQEAKGEKPDRTRKLEDIPDGKPGSDPDSGSPKRKPDPKEVGKGEE